jgi:hypothetical protein
VTEDLESYLAECIKIDDLALDEEFIRTPADLAFWNARYADALRDYMLAKLEHERTAARLHLTIKAQAEDGTIPGLRKPTVSDVEAMVTSSPEFQASALALIEADIARQRARGHVDAVATKKDMLQSLGAKLRAEMAGDPAVRGEHRERRHVKEGR